MKPKWDSPYLGGKWNGWRLQEEDDFYNEQPCEDREDDRDYEGEHFERQ